MNMKSRCFLTLALVLPLLANAQSDSTRIDTATGKGVDRRLELGMSSTDGAYAKVKGDKEDGNDTIRLEFKHKVVRIISTKKIASVLSADSLTEDMDDARRERRNAFTYWSGIDAGHQLLHHVRWPLWRWPESRPDVAEQSPQPLGQHQLHGAEG